jgi:Peptidase family M41/ATPase family associated with various cellular activities (AAA)
MDKEFFNQIKERKEKLEEVKIKLKEKFIGIDNVIDKIIDYISLWYLMPSIQFRPLIISLWGITGVGKTDLVRTLVSLLKFTDKFIEIQMDMKNDYMKNIENFLEGGGIDTKEPAILLLDEIQRYRTINEKGGMVENKHFNDIWTLLSDGRFQNNSERKVQILEMLLDEMYYLDARENENEPDMESEKNVSTEKKSKSLKKRRFKTSSWSANRMKKTLNLNHSVEEIMEMDAEERIFLVQNSLKSDNINEGKFYEKLLIFISGNLDNAFKMSKEIEDSEVDADIYHELSKRINIIDIKEALSYQFKPEQIARFGNNHVIYPCLDKKSYYKIIKINCQKILDRIKNEHNIDIKLSNDIYDIIYRNGVFPTQGVRPAISTVFNILGSNLPYFIYNAFCNDVNKLYIEYNNKCLLSKINKKTYKKEIILEIDNIRENKTIDEKILFIIHENGHALLYSLLFNTPPKQININASGFSDGFIIKHESIDNKTFIRNQIAVLLAGFVAEEIVFGEEFKSNGSSADIINATNIAARYVRHYAMNGTISNIDKEVQQHYESNYDVDKTNNIIENILSEERKRTRDLLNEHIVLYKIIIKHCIDNNGISITDYLRLCNENGLNLIQKEINDKLIYSYDEKVKHFLN